VRDKVIEVCPHYDVKSGICDINGRRVATVLEKVCLDPNNQCYLRRELGELDAPPSKSKSQEKKKPFKLPTKCIFHSRNCGALKLIDKIMPRGKKTVLTFLLKFCELCPHRGARKMLQPKHEG